ncbi:MAG: ExeA family protein [Bacilli bacterium]
MKFLSYYGLEKNLFQKEITKEEAYKSNNFNNMMSRLEYLKEVKGIGLFTGGTGMGKTYTMKYFKETVNEDLYKVIYISATRLTVFEFLNKLCRALGLDVGNCYRNEVEEKIQKTIRKLNKEERKNIILIIDNAENLTSQIILELKILYDFEMESMDYVSIVLIGDEVIKEELRKIKYEAFKQRIIVKYSLENLTREETKEYIKTRLELSGQTNNIFTDVSLNALYQVSKGNIRKLNNLVITSMMIGYTEKNKEINEEIIRLAKEQNEI